MIRNISGGGRYIQVNGGNPVTPYINSSSPGSGMLRWNPSSNCIEISDGNTWKQLNMDYTTIQLSPNAEAILDWAQRKMNEERDLEDLCKRFPGLEKARNNFEMFRRLAETALNDNSDAGQVQASP